MKSRFKKPEQETSWHIVFLTLFEPVDQFVSDEFTICCSCGRAHSVRLTSTTYCGCGASISEER